MYDIKIDSKKNRIYLTVSQIRRDEIRTCLRGLENACLRMRPNYACLVDLRNYGFHCREYNRLIRRAQKVAWETGLNRAVRVVSRAQIEDFRRRTNGFPGGRYWTRYVADLQAAEELLDRLQKGENQSRRALKKEWFKIIGSLGWQDRRRFNDFSAALKRLHRIRSSGKKNTIIVNAGATPFALQRPAAQVAAVSGQLAPDTLQPSLSPPYPSKARSLGSAATDRRSVPVSPAVLSPIRR